MAMFLGAVSEVVMVALGNVLMETLQANKLQAKTGSRNIVEMFFIFILKSLNLANNFRINTNVFIYLGSIN